MKILRHIPSYVDYSQIDSNTRPGLCYSIAELLMRVQRGEPLPPGIGFRDEGLDSDEDSDIDNQMDSAERHPFFDNANRDPIDAQSYVDYIRDKEDQRKRVKEAKKALSDEVKKRYRKPKPEIKPKTE